MCSKKSKNIKLPPDTITVNKKLKTHIKQIKKAKLQTEKLLPKSQLDVAEASIEILWEIVFDYLCSGSVIDTAEMTSLSSVIQRLASSRVQLANFVNKRGNINSTTSPQGEMSEEVIEKIETALKLL